jgi:chemotaxis protein methyltransferase CheR
MHIGDIDFYKEFLHNRAGLQIHQDQSFILDSRLTPVARKWNFPNLRAMTLALRGVPDPAMIDDVLDAVIPMHTEFFRDPELFAQIEQAVLPYFARHSQWNKMRIWSAGCATGEEALSLAMTVRQAQQKLKFRNIEILATDINQISLARAERGLFSQHMVQSIPIALLTQHFKQEDDGWHVSRDLMNMIVFQPFNMLDDMAELGAFDLILCRNVLSGFDEPMKLRVTESLASCLTKDGLLALGADETIPSGLTTLKPLASHPLFLTRPDGPDAL